MGRAVERTAVVGNLGLYSVKKQRTAGIRSPTQVGAVVSCGSVEEPSKLGYLVMILGVNRGLIPAQMKSDTPPTGGGYTPGVDVTGVDVRCRTVKTRLLLGLVMGQFQSCAPSK